MMPQIPRARLAVRTQGHGRNRRRNHGGRNAAPTAGRIISRAAPMPHTPQARSELKAARLRSDSKPAALGQTAIPRCHRRQTRKNSRNRDVPLACCSHEVWTHDTANDTAQRCDAKKKKRADVSAPVFQLRCLRCVGHRSGSGRRKCRSGRRFLGQGDYPSPFQGRPRRKAQLFRRDLTYLDLSGLDFKQASLSRSDLYGTDFTGSNLKAPTSPTPASTAPC